MLLPTGEHAQGRPANQETREGSRPSLSQHSDAKLRSRPGRDKSRPLSQWSFRREGHLSPPDRQLAKSCNPFGRGKSIISGIGVGSR